MHGGYLYIHVWKWWVRDLRVYLAKKRERGRGKWKKEGGRKARMWNTRIGMQSILVLEENFSLKNLVVLSALLTSQLRVCLHILKAFSPLFFLGGGRDGGRGGGAQGRAKVTEVAEIQNDAWRIRKREETEFIFYPPPPKKKILLFLNCHSAQNKRGSLSWEQKKGD